MTKITKRAFYCALAIGILGTYNSMFEAKAAAAPVGLYGAMNNVEGAHGHYLSYSEAKNSPNPVDQAKATEADNLTRVIMENNANVFDSHQGMPKEELIYEMLNAPDDSSIDVKIDNELKTDIEANKGLAIGILAKKIINATSWTKGAKAEDLKSHKDAVMSVLEKVNEANEKIEDAFNRLKDNFETVNREDETRGGREILSYERVALKLRHIIECDNSVQEAYNIINDLNYDTTLGEKRIEVKNKALERERVAGRENILINTKFAHLALENTDLHALIKTYIAKQKTAINAIHIFANFVNEELRRALTQIEDSDEILSKCFKYITSIAAISPTNALGPLNTCIESSFFKVLANKNHDFKRALYAELEDRVKHSGKRGFDIPEPNEDNDFWDHDRMSAIYEASK